MDVTPVLLRSLLFLNRSDGIRVKWSNFPLGSLSSCAPFLDGVALCCHGGGAGTVTNSHHERHYSRVKHPPTHPHFGKNGEGRAKRMEHTMGNKSMWWSRFLRVRIKTSRGNRGTVGCAGVTGCSVWGGRLLSAAPSTIRNRVRVWGESNLESLRSRKSSLCALRSGSRYACPRMEWPRFAFTMLLARGRHRTKVV